MVAWSTSFKLFIKSKKKRFYVCALVELMMLLVLMNISTTFRKNPPLRNCITLWDIWLFVAKESLERPRNPEDFVNRILQLSTHIRFVGHIKNLRMYIKTCHSLITNSCWQFSLIFGSSSANNITIRLHHLF